MSCDKHCMHHDGEKLASGGKVILRTCCHCNHREELFIPDEVSKKLYSYDPSEHGPFAPEKRVRWQ